MGIKLAGLTVLVIGAATLSTAQAETTKLKGSAIKQAVAGKTVHVSTPFGMLPISYRPNGTMNARSPALSNLTGVASDKGRWWVSGARLCQKWNTWLDGKTHCVTLRRSGSRVHWTNASGRTGLARISH